MPSLGIPVSLNAPIRGTDHLVVSIVVLVKITTKPTGWSGNVTIRTQGNEEGSTHAWKAIDNPEGDREIIARSPLGSAQQHAGSHYTFPFPFDPKVDRGIKSALSDWLDANEGDIVVPSRPVSIPVSISPILTKRRLKKPRIPPIPKPAPEPDPAPLPEPPEKPDPEGASATATSNSDSIAAAKRLLEILQRTEDDLAVVSGASDAALRALVDHAEKSAGTGPLIMRIRSTANSWKSFKLKVRKLVRL